MSTSADVSASRRKPVPVYKRRRRRIYGAVAAALVVVIVVVVWAVTRSGGSAAGPLPGFTIAYGQGTVANSDSTIDSDPALAKTIPASLRFVPFDAGVTAIAEMRSGSLQAISGVGNPPVVGAIGTGTAVTVVIAQSFDADALIGQGRLTSAPTAEAVAAHVDPAFVKKALAGTADAVAAPGGPGAAAPGPAGAGHVVLDGVGKTFRRAGRRAVAVAGVSLRVRARELVCLLGPSGCGKSTLLRIVAGALAADQGTVTVGAGR